MVNGTVQVCGKDGRYCVRATYGSFSNAIQGINGAGFRNVIIYVGKEVDAHFFVMREGDSYGGSSSNLEIIAVAHSFDEADFKAKSNALNLGERMSQEKELQYLNGAMRERDNLNEFPMFDSFIAA